MSSFGRSLQRGKAKDLGLLRTKGQIMKVARKARRMWCPTCERVCDSWAEMKWSEPDPGKKVKTLLCRRCETPVTSRSMFELPPGTPEKGLWLRPGPGGWAGNEARLKEAEEEAKRGKGMLHDEAGAGEDRPAGGNESTEAAPGGRVESGGSGEARGDVPPEHLPGGDGEAPAGPRNAPAAGTGARRVGRRSRGG